MFVVETLLLSDRVKLKYRTAVNGHERLQEKKGAEDCQIEGKRMSRESGPHETEGHLLRLTTSTAATTSATTKTASLICRTIYSNDKLFSI